MSNFKKSLLCFGLFFCNFVQADSQHEKLEQKIQFLQALIADIMQNPTLPQEQEGNLSEKEKDDNGDHRMTLRIPKSLMTKIDIKRKQRIGKISRNLWILETLEKATKK